ncbi:hypothetical protein M430DRAFT_33522 [Amorphotheca resinae ATCC 22711]|uniref:Uncharacterized protein n=1 Tax=Amorphotheca resinae ATCC 22711 TaxID=857342 RepID=A0A2T3B7G8_AMORE|nr:hypothetical protein M430DRAFT_33522 [Amorphotheca resinae ATCC 22711]PSS22787.1 hypothetical protein M430DRAFT_33522 [Amorphotheca resinae ATCC 22711]
MPPQLPSDQQRAAVEGALDEIINAIMAHPLWKEPPNQNPMLVEVWDFVMRSRYMLSEYENVKAGRPLRFPDQFQGAGSVVGTGNTGALHVYQDVCSRTMILGMLMKDSSGTIGMLTGEAVPPVDFGPRVMNAVKALQQVCPMEDVMAGMMR